MVLDRHVPGMNKATASSTCRTRINSSMVSCAVGLASVAALLHERVKAVYEADPTEDHRATLMVAAKLLRDTEATYEKVCGMGAHQPS